MTDWPFDQPRNCAALTTRQVVYSGMPVLLVSHDADDGGWQFLHGGGLSSEDAMVVGLGEVLKLDSTVAQIADLPVGWHAAREYVGGPWTREPQTREEE